MRNIFLLLSFSFCCASAQDSNSVLENTKFREEILDTLVRTKFFIRNNTAKQYWYLSITITILDSITLYVIDSKHITQLDLAAPPSFYCTVDGNLLTFYFGNNILLPRLYNIQNFYTHLSKNFPDSYQYLYNKLVGRKNLYNIEIFDGTDYCVIKLLHGRLFSVWEHPR